MNNKIRKIGICKKCGFSIKYGEWYAKTNLHFFCMNSKDLTYLREEGKKMFEEGQKNMKKHGMGSHFGGRYDGFCLEI